jgi:type I restriction enzyme S subunit
MKSPWRKVPVKTIYKGFWDGPHATPKKSDDEPIFLGIKNITEDGHLDFSSVRHISERDFPRWTRRVVPQAGDIVFTYEATLHRYAILPEGFRGCLGRRVALIRPDDTKVDTRYLLYYFLGSDWREEVSKHVILGATVDRIPLIEFPDFEIRLPPLPTQRKIAAILSAYDDLIENNTRRIQILEEMARSIYRQWFVEFKYPGYEDIPLVDSGTEQGQIPENWQVKKMGEIAKVNAESIGKSNPPKKINYVDISSVSTGQIDEIRSLDFTDSPSRARRIARHGDVIFSTVRPNRKSYSLIIHPLPNLIVSTGFAVLTSITVPFTFLYYAVTTDEFVGYLTNRAQGAAYPAVNAGDFTGADLIIPREDLLNKFNKIVEDMVELKHSLLVKNANLRTTRDLLLPRLVSGELDVSQLEIQ